MSKIIHVNVNVIRHNKKYNNTLPPCRIQEGSKTRYSKSVYIDGPSTLTYSPDAPLKCGAKLWIETDAPVLLIGEQSYSAIKEAMEEISK